MNKESNGQDKVEAANDRREFLRTAGKFGITAPMAALLLSVKSKNATAKMSYGSRPHGS